MPQISAFYRHYSTRLGVNVPRNAQATVNLDSPRLRFAPALDAFFRKHRVPALLRQLELLGEGAARRNFEMRKDLLCAAPSTGGRSG